MICHILQDLFLHLGRNLLHCKAPFRLPAGRSPLIPQGLSKGCQLFRRDEQLLFQKEGRLTVIVTVAAIGIHQQMLPSIHSICGRIGIVCHTGEIELHLAIGTDTKSSHCCLPGGQGHLCVRQFLVQIPLRPPAELILRDPCQLQRLRQRDHPILLPVINERVNLSVISGAGRIQIKDQIVISTGDGRIEDAPFVSHLIHRGCHGALISASEDRQGLIDLPGTLTHCLQLGNLNIVTHDIIVLGLHGQPTTPCRASAGHQTAAQANTQCHRRRQDQSGPLMPDKKVAQPPLRLFGRSAHMGGQPGMGHFHQASPPCYSSSPGPPICIKTPSSLHADMILSSGYPARRSMICPFSASRVRLERRTVEKVNCDAASSHKNQP